jgi:hypothetical protein
MVVKILVIILKEQELLKLVKHVKQEQVFVQVQHMQLFVFQLTIYKEQLV